MTSPGRASSAAASTSLPLAFWVTRRATRSTFTSANADTANGIASPHTHAITNTRFFMECIAGPPGLPRARNGALRADDTSSPTRTHVGSAIEFFVQRERRPVLKRAGPTACLGHVSEPGGPRLSGSCGGSAGLAGKEGVKRSGPDAETVRKGARQGTPSPGPDSASSVRRRATPE